MALLNDILKYHESSDSHIPVPVLKVCTMYHIPVLKVELIKPYLIKPYFDLFLIRSLQEVYKEVMKACDTNNNETIQKCELALLLTSV